MLRHDDGAGDGDGDDDDGYDDDGVDDGMTVIILVIIFFIADCLCTHDSVYICAVTMVNSTRPLSAGVLPLR